MTDSTETTPTSEFARIALPTTAVIGKVEEAFNIFYNSHPKQVNSLVISFSEVGRTDLPSLGFMLAIAIERNRVGLTTKFEPPKNPYSGGDVRNYLRTWRFFETLVEICGGDEAQYQISPEIWSSFTTTYVAKKSSSGDYFEERHMSHTKDNLAKYLKKNPALRELYDRLFFPLMPKPFWDIEQQKSTLRKARNEWNRDSLIVSVLQNVFSKSGNNLAIENRLADDVIKEAITNSIHHPKAKHLVIGSQFAEKRVLSSDGSGSLIDIPESFTVVIWDDGDSILETITSIIQSETVSIKNESYFNPAYLCKVKDADSARNQKEELVFCDDFILNLAPEWKLFLASFFPGVTSKPKVEDRHVLDDHPQLPLFEQLGMGLPILVDTIVSSFGGTVSVRIGSYFIYFQRPGIQQLRRIYKENCAQYYFQTLTSLYRKDGKSLTDLRIVSTVYSVTIEKKKGAFDFRGNLLTLRIPFKVITD